MKMNEEEMKEIVGRIIERRKQLAAENGRTVYASVVHLSEIWDYVNKHPCENDNSEI